MTNLDKKFIIAIDGGSATGKSVLAKEIANRLNILYIDTGAMYRAAAYYFITNNIELNDENINKHINNIDIKLQYEDNNTLVFLNENNITEYIRTEEISMGASNISKFKIIREKLVQLQRKMAEGQSVVLEGRDITTVVFPDADLKIFLTANVEIRAKRRKRDLEKKQQYLSIEEIKKSLLKRDEQDSNREESPLRKTEDSIQIDTSDLTNDKTVEMVIKLLKERI